MKKIIGALMAVLTISACAEKEKSFNGVSTGMTKEEVVGQVGEPNKKNDLAFAELWTYDNADRTIVFRSDTVYDILTSTEARIDSIEADLKETGSSLREKIDNTVDSLDSGSLRIKNKIMRDSAGRNRSN